MDKLTFSRTEQDFLKLSRMTSALQRRWSVVYIIAAVVTRGLFVPVAD